MRMSRVLLTTLVVLLLAGCAGYSPVQVAPELTSRAADQVREGIIELNRGNNESAGERFEAALFLDPELAEAHYNLAIVRHNQGKHAEATQHLKEAAGLAPDNALIVRSEFYLKHVKR